MDDWLTSSSKCTCRRCFCQDSIPTYQFVKFDTKQHYLCQRCWEDFRSWFFWRREAAPRTSSEELQV